MYAPPTYSIPPDQLDHRVALARDVQPGDLIADDVHNRRFFGYKVESISSYELDAWDSTGRELTPRPRIALRLNHGAGLYLDADQQLSILRPSWTIEEGA